MQQALGFENNNTRLAFDVVKQLTNEKTARTATIKDTQGNLFAETKKVQEGWTEYIRELYNHPITTDNTALSALAEGVLGPEDTGEPDFLRSEIEMPVKKPKNGKAAGFDNIPAELLKNGGDDIIEALHKICNSVWQSGVWVLQWTRSLIIPLPKKGNLRKCNNYRTISLISYPSKVLLTVINSWLKSRAEDILAEEQAGFRSGISAVEQNYKM